MKRFIPILLCVALVLSVLLVSRHKQVVKQSEQEMSPRQEQQQSNAVSSAPETKSASPQARPLSTGQAISDAVKEYVRKSTADPQYDWKRPINFYGRVVDENNSAVVGAVVNFEWNDLSAKGTSKDSTTSDINGFFSLLDRRGKRLYVDVGKTGYYSSGDARNATFEYANPADGLFTPNPNRPIVFHLRKKGVGVDLITSQYGVKLYFGVTVPLDGAAVQADLLERRTGQGALAISQIKPQFKNWQQATNWIFRMEIPDGGFVGENDEFQFTAPETGYQPEVEFNFQKNQSDWQENLKTNYYIKFGNPPRYGWLKLDTSIMMEGARLTYAINPDGSRNLEPK